MQTAFGEMIVFLVRNGYSDKTWFWAELQSELIFPPVHKDFFWQCSRVYMFK